MSTTIKTSIKDNVNIKVKETVLQVYNELIGKGSFVLLTRLDFSNKESKCIIRKSSIKMVKS